MKVKAVKLFFVSMKKASFSSGNRPQRSFRLFTLNARMDSNL